MIPQPNFDFFLAALKGRNTGQGQCPLPARHKPSANRLRTVQRVGLSLLFASATTLAGATGLQPLEHPARTALKCMTQGPAQASLDLSDIGESKNAFVRVLLRFTSADQPPSSEVIFKSGSDALAERVLAHVASYRLPCWTPETPVVTAVQEFSLEGGKSEFWWTAGGGDGAQAKRAGQQYPACIQPRAFSLTSAEAEKLPDAIVNVHAVIRFTDGVGRAPQVSVKSLTAPKAIVQAVKAFAESYRTHCPLQSGSQWFMFAPAGEVKANFNKALSLTAMLRASTPASRGGPLFDFSTMACPFSVKIEMLQPLGTNVVSEVGPPNPNRAAFLSWMEGLELAMKPAELEYFLGQQALVNIPCGQMDLRP
jgi:hypothetical protein